jgi:AhpD family alkylhydroperoxidase
VLITASVVNGCAYCVAAHSTMALRADLDPDTVAALRAGKPVDEDVILGVGVKTLSTYTNHIAHTPLDPAWAGQEWTPTP